MHIEVMLHQKGWNTFGQNNCSAAVAGWKFAM